MLTVIGKVFLGGNQFTTDPRIAREWSPRRSRLLGIGGSVTQQDFGRFAKDMRLTLTSEGNYMNAALKNAIDLMLVTAPGASYSYSDYTGLEATVVIVAFDPRPTFIRDGDTVLYDYSLVLDVVALAKLDGADYGGE